MMKQVLFSTFLLAVLVSQPLAATYYVNPEHGNDAGTGSEGDPWRSIQRTLSLGMNSIDLAKVSDRDETTVVVLKGGNYGDFSLSDGDALQKTTAGSPHWITYKAAPGEDPLFTSMNFVFNSRTPLFIRFEGIKIIYPGKGPENGLAKTAQASEGPVSLRNVSDVEYVNSIIWGEGRTSGGGIPVVYVNDCSNLLFNRCDIAKRETGMSFSGCQNVTISYNQIHEGCSSGVKYATGNSDFLFEGNHIHDFPNINELHGSVISIRSGDVIIRGNIMHNGFSSSGMMTYLDTPIPYSNITIENNLVYDIGNPYVMRIYHLGENVTFRNNTFVGHRGDTPDARYGMDAAFILESIADGYDGSGLSLYNNVFVGIFVCQNSNVRTGNNIMWSYNHEGFDFSCTPPEPNSHVLACSYSDDQEAKMDYFYNGFFEETPDFTFNHGTALNFRPAAGSPAINFGDPANQPSTSLGTLGPDGFIQPNGLVRDANHHSAGAYEFGGEVSVYFRDFQNTVNPSDHLSNAVYDILGRSLDPVAIGVLFGQESMAGSHSGVRLLVKTDRFGRRKTGKTLGFK
jgi:hypothetical protein